MLGPDDAGRAQRAGEFAVAREPSHLRPVSVMVSFPPGSEIREHVRCRQQRLEKWVAIVHAGVEKAGDGGIARRQGEALQ